MTQEEKTKYMRLKPQEFDFSEDDKEQVREIQFALNKQLVDISVYNCRVLKLKCSKCCLKNICNRTVVYGQKLAAKIIESKSKKNEEK